MTDEEITHELYEMKLGLTQLKTDSVNALNTINTTLNTINTTISAGLPSRKIIIQGRLSGSSGGQPYYNFNGGTLQSVEWFGVMPSYIPAGSILSVFFTSYWTVNDGPLTFGIETLAVHIGGDMETFAVGPGIIFPAGLANKRLTPPTINITVNPDMFVRIKIKRNGVAGADMRFFNAYGLIL